MHEKRRFSRCRIKEKVKIKKEEANPDAGEAFDISTGGMGILLDKPIKIGSRLSGQLKILPQLDPFFVEGRVVWMKPYLDTEGECLGYAVGIKFTKVSTIPFKDFD